MTLPDCPHGCDAANTLEVERIEPRGIRVCVCTCCARVCRVNTTGQVVHRATPAVIDVNGVPMFEP